MRLKTKPPRAPLQLNLGPTLESSRGLVAEAIIDCMRLLELMLRLVELLLLVLQGVPLGRPEAPMSATPAEPHPGKAFLRTSRGISAFSLSAFPPSRPSP